MCVIFYTNKCGDLILAKNRDRNYNPEIQIIHEIKNGIEIVYIKDLVSGWIEGINENGNAIVNSSLSLKDTKKYVVKSKNKKNFMYQALFSTDKEGFLRNVEKVYGHNIAVFDNTLYHMETIKNEKYFLENKDKNKSTVYSNHLIKLRNNKSIKRQKTSVMRKKIIETELKQMKHSKTFCQGDVYNNISKLLNKNYADISQKYQPYRDKGLILKETNIVNEKVVFTTGQVIINCTKKEFIYYNDIHNRNEEYINKLPRGYKPKIKVVLKKVKKNKTQKHFYTKNNKTKKNRNYQNNQ
jgi:hypothetical protein